MGNHYSISCTFLCHLTANKSLIIQEFLSSFGQVSHSRIS